MELTEEQKAIVESEGNLVVSAVAGSGKTSTLIQYVKRRPRDSFLYIVYNKAAKEDAAKKFKREKIRNVTIETAHSMAYKKIVIPGGYTVGNPLALMELIAQYKLHEKFKISLDDKALYILSSYIYKLISGFCNSKLRKIQSYDLMKLCQSPVMVELISRYSSSIIEFAVIVLNDMVDKKTPMIHDYYLKLFQLSKPRLNYDYILFDEAQDASPVMLDIFKRQDMRSTLIAVGDSHQQIYSWRYAVNALGKFDWNRLSLTTSFRFGKKIATLANHILEWKKLFAPVDVEVKGVGGHVKGGTSGRLSRTNIGLLEMILDEMDGLKSIYFEGNLHSYTFADTYNLYDVLSLFCGNKDRINNPVIKSFEGITQLKNFAELTEDRELLVMISIVIKHGAEIFPKLREIKEKATTKKDKADAIFSTVHKSKGLEYDSLELGKGFLTIDAIEKFVLAGSPESELGAMIENLNVLYVAVTRSRGRIHLPEYLDYLDDTFQLQRIWEIQKDVAEGVYDDEDEEEEVIIKQLK